MATVTKRGKKWSAIYIDANGKQVWKTAYTDKIESQRYADRMEDEARRIRLGDIDPQVEARRKERSKIIDQHIDEYKTTLAAGGREPGTVAYVIADVKAFVSFSAATGSPLVSAGEITRPMIDRWVADQQKRQKAKEDGFSNSTINRRVGSVQQFLRHLHEHGGCSAYTLNKYPKLSTSSAHRTRQTRALTSDELESLLTSDDVPQSRRDRYAVAARTGLRLGELRQMIGSYFDLKKKLVHIPAHIAKARIDQTIPLHLSLIPILKRLCDGKTDTIVFADIPTKQHVLNQLRTDAAAAKISKPDALGFHSLRHTFCTALAQRNVHPALLQKLARHADLKTTLGYYVHFLRTDEASALNSI